MTLGVNSGSVVKTGKPSNSRDLISTGPKDVQKHHGKHDERQREVRPTTERALVLRNGKYGAQGTDVFILMTKMTGREKLDLLAGAFPGIFFYFFFAKIDTMLQRI